MSGSYDKTKYDKTLESILLSEKSVLGFLSAIFSFLGRRTDFYYVPQNPKENMGFPPGVAEELVIKVFKACDPKTWVGNEDTRSQADVNNEIMCSTVAQEVEVVAEGDEATEDDNPSPQPSTSAHQTEEENTSTSDTQPEPESYTPPVIPTQKNSETYNGAARDNYSWSQTIMDLDATVKLPPDIKSAKSLKVNITAANLSVITCNGDTIIKDSFPYKIKPFESFWSISEGKLLLHFEKVQERWWNKLLSAEEELDFSKIDCSRPLNELPDDHIDKVRELQWNQDRKMKGLPTSDEIRNINILKKAWNSPGSPFIGQEFDPSVLNKSGVFPPMSNQK